MPLAWPRAEPWLSQPPAGPLVLAPEWRRTKRVVANPLGDPRGLTPFAGSAAPQRGAGARNRCFSFIAGAPTSLSAAAPFSGYPIVFVGVVKFADVTTNTALSTLGAISGGSHRAQIDVSSGTLRWIIVGDSVWTISANVSVGRWYRIVAVAQTATDRRLYLDGVRVAAGTESTTISDAATTVAFGCGANGAFQTGGNHQTSDVALAAWLQAPLSDKAACALSNNPWSLYEPAAGRALLFPVTGTDLAIADATHGHSPDNLALTQVHTLSVAEATHAQLADALGLSQAHQLAAQDATHTHTADSLVLVQAHLLAIADAMHAQAADNLVLSDAVTLAVNDALHAQAAEGATLTQAHALAVADVLHAHAADALALGQVHVLVVSDALHAQLADAAVLSLPGAVLARERALLIPGEHRTLLVLPESRALAIASEGRHVTIH